MIITLSQDEVIEAVRAHVATTLPQLNFDNADISMNEDGVDIDLDSVNATEPKSDKPRARRAKRTVKADAKPAETASEPAEEVKAEEPKPEPKAEPEAVTEIVEEPAEEPEQAEAIETPWNKEIDAVTEPFAPSGLSEVKTPAKSLFAM